MTAEDKTTKGADTHYVMSSIVEHRPSTPLSELF